MRVVRQMPPLSDDLERRVGTLWEAACARHSLFNGRVFSVDGVTPNVISGHWTEYRRAVAQMQDPALRHELGVRNLAVCGVIQGPDGVLMGRRAANAIYQPGLWQLPPAGSVDDSAATAEGADLRHALMAELREELGLKPDDVRDFQPLCLVEHPGSGVTDLGIALRTDLTLAEIGAAHDACGDREYDGLIAAAPHALDAEIARIGGEMVPPARLFLAALAHAS